MTNYDFDAAHRQARSSQQEGSPTHGPGSQLPPDRVNYPASGLLSSSALKNRCNAPARAGATLAMQGTHGNRAVQRSMQANPNSSSAGRVSVQRTGLGTVIPSVMDQARRAAAIAAASKPKEDQSGGWPDLPDWLNSDTIGNAGSDLLNGMFGGPNGPGGSGSPTDEGWFEGV